MVASYELLIRIIGIAKIVAMEQVISMTNKNYVKGRNFEYRTMSKFRSWGYYCIRAYASKGLVDVVAVPPYANADWYNFPLGIQCKYNGYVPKEEMKKLLECRTKWQMNIVIAWSDKGKFRIRGLDGITWSINALKMKNQKKPEPPIDWKKAQQELIKVGENLQ